MNNPSDVLTAERCEVECVHPEHVTPLLGRILDYAGADRVAATFGVLADPTRARILHALSLADTELCVCDLAVLLGISQSALSHQLRLLRDRNVVARTKRGRMVYYRLADEHIRHVFADGVRHAGEGGAVEDAGAA
jgi:DNA-binding transcriptional ArsR family regulator